MEIASGIKKFSPDWLSGCNEFGWVSPNHQTGRNHMSWTARRMKKGESSHLKHWFCFEERFRHNCLLLLENFGSLETLCFHEP
ncbi:hypothetical protein CY35_02G202400 [Sphagnum magellanicum]|nr:hypothetical protein CY35_02G202400 [Sphagnum magellanicum]